MKQKWKPTKSKTEAIILAVFFGLFAYIYTYKYESHKFWILLLIAVFFSWTIIAPLTTWLFAIVDMAYKDKQFYEEYYEH